MAPAQEVQDIINTANFAYFRSLSGSTVVYVTALIVVSLYCVFPWNLARFYAPFDRLKLFDQKLSELEQVIKNYHDVLQEYGNADSIDGQIRR
jgi:hypothetical protein